MVEDEEEIDIKEEREMEEEIEEDDEEEETGLLFCLLWLSANFSLALNQVPPSFSFLTGADY